MRTAVFYCVNHIVMVFTEKVNSKTGLSANFVKTITDSEKQIFAKLVFFRFGVKNDNKNELQLFEDLFKSFISTPIKDKKIKKKLLILMSGTRLISDNEIIFHILMDILLNHHGRPNSGRT